jgi:hypothetical protein
MFSLGTLMALDMTACKFSGRADIDDGHLLAALHHVHSLIADIFLYGAAFAGTVFAC